VLTDNRKTPGLEGVRTALPVKGGVQIFSGALVVIEAGFLVPGKTALNLTHPSKAEKWVDNRLGADGDVTCPVTNEMAFGYHNDGSVTSAHVGSKVYIIDDETVGVDNTGKSVAGTVTHLEGGLVYVDHRRI